MLGRNKPLRIRRDIALIDRRANIGGHARLVKLVPCLHEVLTQAKKEAPCPECEKEPWWAAYVEYMDLHPRFGTPGLRAPFEYAYKRGLLACAAQDMGRR